MALNTVEKVLLGAVFVLLFATPGIPDEFIPMGLLLIEMYVLKR